MKNLTVLDCTLRDGGYYTNWCYEKELVDEYLNAMRYSGINVVEIGLRVPSSNNYFGPFAFCREDFLEDLKVPNEIDLAVMINAKDYLKDDESNLSLVDRKFKSKKESFVSIVRIACHLEEVSKIFGVAKKLHKLGYRIGLNLMQAASKTKEQVQSTCLEVKSWNFVEVLYFADSMGAMSEADIVNMISTMRESWDGAIGIHAHNNLGQALKNTLVACENGVNWLDCTMTGMGRGAGNCPSEYLLLELNEKEDIELHPESLFHAILGHFSPLQKKFEWGPNLLYYLSGKYDIHPTYVQTILNSEQQKSHKLILAMKRLKESSTSTFSELTVKEAFEKESYVSKGDWNAEKLIKGKDVLIIGSGPSVEHYREGIINYIKNNDVIVLSLNINKFIPEEFVDAYVACNPTRIVSSYGSYEKLKKPLIAPSEILKQYGKEQRNFELLNYGLVVSADSFSIEGTQCQLKGALAFPYAFAVSVAGKSKSINLVGFDGYDHNDPRQNEMKNIINEFVKKQDVEVFSMTPTTYRFNKKSIYA